MVCYHVSRKEAGSAVRLRIALPLLLILVMMRFCSKEFPKQRAVAAHLSAFAVLLIVVMSSGCAGGGSSAVNNQPPTNAMLTITGTSGSVKHQLNLSLTVHH
jgi:chromate transport protein ChrA